MDTKRTNSRFTYRPPPFPPRSCLQEVFHYDPEQGVLRKMVKGEWVKVGQSFTNYRRTRIRSSWVCYVMHTGEDITGLKVMHLDGDRCNWRADNLESVFMTTEELQLAELRARRLAKGLKGDPGYSPESLTAPVPLPPLSLLKKVFDYDPHTGILHWRKDSISRYGVRLAGDPAGTPDRKGFLKVRVGNGTYSVTRIAWKIYWRQDPGRRDVTHEDNDPGNNRIENLLAGRLTFTPRKGVRFDPDRAQWRASFRFGGITTQLGYFETGEEAQEAVDAARASLEAEFGTPAP